MKVAIMQPYIFPYLGYFQLANAVDHFVFYDDVNFIKGGWINRNAFLANGQPQNFVIPCQGISSFKRINEIHVDIEQTRSKKILKSISQAYSKAPFFSELFPLVVDTFDSNETRISHVAGTSVEAVGTYLNLKCQFSYSSELFGHTRDLDREGRIIAICKELGATHYINPLGGSSLYSKDTFNKCGIEFCTLSPELISYRQKSSEFVKSLSIIDLLMNENQKACQLQVEQGEIE